jgi:molybdate transport system substrate-binding protein
MLVRGARLRQGHAVPKAILALVLVFGLIGCGNEGAPSSHAPSPELARLRVRAAASLADVLPPLARAFEESTHTIVEVELGASSTLAQQIRSGADCDAFIAADPRWAQALVDEHLGDAATRRIVATNALVAIVPADAATAPTDLAALAALPHIAVAGPEVPAGMHARTAFTRAALLAIAEPHFVNATDVRGALLWVARGEAEAGIVYATDARAEPRVRVAFPLAPETHDPVLYEAIALRDTADAPTSELGQRFVTFLGESDAQAAFASAGFGPPP